MQKEIVRYSDEYKEMVVSMLEKKVFDSIESCKKTLKISGSNTVTRWISQLKPELLPTIRNRIIKDDIQKLKETDPKLYEKIMSQVE